MNTQKYFIECLNYLKIELSNQNFDLFDKYCTQIIYWNEKINITSILDKQEIYLKHFIDSLFLMNVIKFKDQSVADIGTGAGLPGLALKIANQNIKMTFIDSSKKKMMVLESIIGKLGISGCTIIADNIENTGRSNQHREVYDIVTSRALGQFNVVLELGIPLLKPNGLLVQYKGPSVDKEVENSQKALDLLGAEIKKTIEFKLPFSDIKRSIVIVEKKSSTNIKYPRKSGIPKKKPL